MALPNSTLRRWIVLAVKLLIVVVVLWLVRGTMKQSWSYLVEHPRSLSPNWLALSGGLYLLALLPEGLFWHWTLKALGQDVGLFETLRAYYIGHLGKYVPGKAMVIVLRTGLIHSHRVDTSIAVASVFLETLTMMAVGACIAVPVLAIWFSHNPAFIAAAVATAIVGGLPTLPPVFSRLARLLGVGRSSPAVAQKLAGFDYRTLICGWTAMVAGWVVMGTSLWAMLRGLGCEADLAQSWYLYTAIVAMAVVVGFASMIPGGLFAREAVFTGLLAPMLGGDASTALIVAAALRLTWLVAELLISAILYSVRWVLPKL
ncbi:MAG: lysylphosphatidylglycerol synthase transmembrane domain-containing protein [Planctomycetota bacterium]